MALYQQNRETQSLTAPQSASLEQQTLVNSINTLIQDPGFTPDPSVINHFMKYLQGVSVDGQVITNVTNNSPTSATSVSNNRTEKEKFEQQNTQASGEPYSEGTDLSAPHASSLHFEQMPVAAKVNVARELHNAKGNIKLEELQNDDYSEKLKSIQYMLLALILENYGQSNGKKEKDDYLKKYEWESAIKEILGMRSDLQKTSPLSPNGQNNLRLLDGVEDLRIDYGRNIDATIKNMADAQRLMDDILKKNRKD